MCLHTIYGFGLAFSLKSTVVQMPSSTTWRQSKYLSRDDRVASVSITGYVAMKQEPADGLHLQLAYDVSP